MVVVKDVGARLARGFRRAWWFVFGFLLLAVGTGRWMDVGFAVACVLWMVGREAFGEWRASRVGVPEA